MWFPQDCEPYGGDIRRRQADREEKAKLDQQVQDWVLGEGQPSAWGWAGAFFLQIFFQVHMFLQVHVFCIYFFICIFGSYFCSWIYFCNCNSFLGKGPMLYYLVNLLQVKIENQKLDWNVTAKVFFHLQNPSSTYSDEGGINSEYAPSSRRRGC